MMSYDTTSVNLFFVTSIKEQGMSFGIVNLDFYVRTVRDDPKDLSVSHVCGPWSRILIVAP